MSTLHKLSKMIWLLFIITEGLYAQTERWIYHPPDNYVSAHYGAARSVTYGLDGNIYAAGGAPCAGKGITFEKTYGEPGLDEGGRCVQQTSDGNYIILWNIGLAPSFLSKIDVYGDTIWTKTISGGEAKFIQETTDKGFIITGKDSGQMFLTKTDSLGNILWTKYCFSPSNGGNCVQQTSDGGYIMVGDNQSSSLVIVKTDSLGNVIWTKLYSAPGPMKGHSVEQTADQGYIIGGSWGDGASFYAMLLKTDSLGDTLWTKKYADDAWTIGCVAHQTYDGGYVLSALLYSAGDYWIIKTDSAGDSVWTKQIDASSFNYWCDLVQNVDSGYIIAGTLNNSDIGLWKIDRLGNELWSSLFGGDSIDCSLKVWQTNDKGYIVVGGSKSFGQGDWDVYLIKTDSLGTPITRDFTVVSLTPIGDERWIYKYNGPGNDFDEGFSVVQGLDNNIYTAGYTTATSTGFLYLTVISLDTTGTERWVYQDTTSPTVLPLTIERAMVIYGLDGSIYAMGHHLIVSLTSAGNINWIYQPANMSFLSLIQGADGNLYATGYSYPGGQDAFMIVSISPSGAERWHYQYDSGGNYDMGKAIVQGLDGNIYAAGCLGSSDNKNFVVISVDTLGVYRWIYSHDTGSEDIAYAITYGSNNNIYVGGLLGSPYASDWAVVSLTPSGAENWIHSYNGPANADDWANAICYGTDGNIYTTGWSETTTDIPNFTIISNSDSGVENWVYRDSPGWGWSIVYGSDNNIYSAGEGADIITGYGFVVISIRTVGIEENRNKRQEARYKLEVYPNPFRNAVSIKFQIPNLNDQTNSKSQISLKIYDATGRVVKNLSFHPASFIIHNSVEWDGTDNSGRRLPAGIYFVRFEAGNYKQTEKVILLK